MVAVFTGRPYRPVRWRPLRGRRWLAVARAFAWTLALSSPTGRTSGEGTPSGSVAAAPSEPDPHGVVAALYQQHAPALLAYLNRHLPALADAEDALAEVFVAALHASAGGKSPDLPWLLLVARRRIADFYRGRERAAPCGGAVAAATAATADVRTQPEHQALAAEERQHLRALVGALPPEQRDVLALRFAAGLRAPQIAALLGKSDEAIRAQLSRALRRLRQEWPQ